MEEFFLGRIFSCNKLNIVYKKNIRTPVTLMEFPCCAVADCLNQLIGKFVAFDVDDVHIRVSPADFIPDGIKQVRFSKAGISVDKKRVIKCRRFACDSHGCSVRKFIGRADDKGIKRKLIVFVLRGFFLFLLFNLVSFLRRHQADLNLLAENLPECFFNHILIIMENRLPMKFVWNFQNGNAVCKIKRNRFNPADPCGKCNFRDLAFAIGANHIPYFCERFHSVTIPHLFFCLRTVFRRRIFTRP